MGGEVDECGGLLFVYGEVEQFECEFQPFFLQFFALEDVVELDHLMKFDYSCPILFS